MRSETSLKWTRPQIPLKRECKESDGMCVITHWLMTYGSCKNWLFYNVLNTKSKAGLHSDVDGLVLCFLLQTAFLYHSFVLNRGVDVGPIGYDSVPFPNLSEFLFSVIWLNTNTPVNPSLVLDDKYEALKSVNRRRLLQWLHYVPCLKTCVILILFVSLTRPTAMLRQWPARV